MKEKYRLVWSEGVKVKYFVGYSANGTVWSEHKFKAFDYDTQEQAEFGINQVKSIMVVNEKRPVRVVDAFLSIESTTGHKVSGGVSKKADDAYKKAMDIV